MRWRAAVLAASVLVSATTLNAQAPAYSYRPVGGFVPDSITAVRIAEAIWTPIYGAARIQAERPYHATLARGIWTVTGSLPRGTAGGVAVAELAQRDARVRRVSHGR